MNAVLPAKGATLEQGLHRDLHAPLRAGLDVILSGGREVWESETEVALSEEETHRLSLRLERLDGRGRDAVLLLSMIRIPAPAIRVPQLVRAVPPSVERDLSRARDQLQQAEARLRANTEAFRATNAQLRLMYEDLLRSHQDLHAVNQELVAVSAENERRIETLSERNREMDLALTGMQAGLIVLDEDLRLCRFNSLAGQILGLERQDIFQRIGALGARLDLPELAELARQAAERNGPAERSCRFRSGVLSVLALPSGPAAGGRSGPVLVFTLQQPSQNLAAG